MYGYSQDPYQQQAAWQAWHQQQASGDGSQQVWASATSTGHAQNQQPQYIAYPIAAGMAGSVATPPPPPPPPPEAPPTTSGVADFGGVQGTVTVLCIVSVLLRMLVTLIKKYSAGFSPVPGQGLIKTAGGYGFGKACDQLIFFLALYLLRTIF